jgi:xylulokinase
MAGADKDLVLGYDFGTSAVKAVLVDREGRLRASGTATYPLLIKAPGWVEQRPLDWWAAMAQVMPDLLAEARADASRVAAIAVAAQMCGVVPVNSDGEALANCLIWLDARSSDIAERMVGGSIKIGGYGLFNLIRWLRLTGGAPNPSGRDPPSKMLWLREHEPSRWPHTHKLLDVADFLVHRLTGRFVTSFDRAHLTWLFDARPKAKQWSASLLGRVGLDRALLPDVLRATDVAGGLRSGAAEALGLRADTPVAVGLGDLSAAACAAGTPAPGAPHLNVGTSAWLGAAVTQSKVNPLTNIGSISSADGENYLLIATQENAGACVNWALHALGFSAGEFARFEAEAAEVSPRSDGPLFFPWLTGERVPIDNKHLRGGFVGASLNDRRGEMARAVYEGVGLNLRWAMRDFDRLAGSAGQPARFVGGGANSALWCQMLADILGRTLERLETPALAGARGSAMVAAVAAGWFKDLAAASTMARTDRSFVPDTQLAAHYAERFERFTAGYKRLRPWYARYGAVDLRAAERATHA